MAWIGPAIAAGGSLIGGMMGRSASSKAAEAQAQASRDSIAEQRRQYDLTRSDNAPWMQAGSATLAKLMQGLGLAYGPSTTTTSPGPSTGQPQQPAFNDGAEQGPDGTWRKFMPGEDGGGNWATLNDFKGQVNPAQSQNMVTTTAGPQAPDPNDPFTGSLMRKFTMADRDADPVYQSGLQFGLDQGTKGINARAIAGGGYDSGATLKALTQFGNDYGSTKAGDAFNRYNAQNDSIYNKLTGVSGSGQVATAQVGQAGQNMANNVSQSMQDIGNSRAAGIVGGSQAYGSAAQGVNSAVNGYQNNQVLQQLLKNRGYGGGAGSGYGAGNGYNYSQAMYDVGG